MLEDHVLTPKVPPAHADPTARALKGPSGEEAEAHGVTLSALQQQFSSVTSEVAELARLVRGGARSVVHAAVDRADDMRHDTTDRAREVEHQAIEWIKERPLQAAILSMGLGALLWSMLKRS